MAARPCRAHARPRAPLSARILRRPAAADRHRARARVAAEDHRRRRSGVGARRLHPGADRELAARPAAGVRPVVPVHLARHGGGRAGEPPRRRDVPGADRRDRTAPCRVRRPATSLYAAADGRRAGRGPDPAAPENGVIIGRGPKSDPGRRRRAAGRAPPRSGARTFRCDASRRRCLLSAMRPRRIAFPRGDTPMTPLYRSFAAATLAAAIALPAHAAKDVVFAVASTFTTTDPYDANDTLSQAMAKSFYEGLFGFDRDMKLIPVLAESYDVSKDGLVYTIKLRKGVKFHDGTDFNAEAVKANFDRVTNPDNKLKRYALYSNIAKTEVVDPSTARITLKTPFSAFINNLAHPSGVMISPAALKQYLSLIHI